MKPETSLSTPMGDSWPSELLGRPQLPPCVAERFGGWLFFFWAKTQTKQFFFSRKTEGMSFWTKQVLRYIVHSM